MNKKNFFSVMLCAITIGMNAQGTYVAFHETFGTPTTVISQKYDNPLYTVPFATGSISGVCNFIPYPNNTTTADPTGNRPNNIYPVSTTQTAWYNNGSNNYYGIITSATLFGGATVGYGGSGGFLAFTFTSKGATQTAGNDTFWRTMIPGDRFVKNSIYTFSGQAAADAGASWNPANEAATARQVNYSIKAVFYHAVVSVGPNYFNTITNISGVLPTSVNTLTAITNGAGWIPFSVTCDPAGVQGDVVFDLRVDHSKSTVILVDELQVTGARPVITAQQNSADCSAISLSATSTSPALSDVLAVSCNHAGKTPITATITGDGASYFTLCDVNGNPVSQTYAITGDNIYVKFSPDASVISTQTATLTLTASSDPTGTYGAAPVTIALTGNISVATGTITPSAKEVVISEHGNTVTVKVGEQSRVQIFSASGSLIKDTFVTDSFNCALSAGVYIIKVNGVSHKFVKK